MERERCLPRKEGMAQKPQFRSHPSATLMYDHGAALVGRGEVEEVEGGEGRRCGRLPGQGHRGADRSSGAGTGGIGGFGGIGGERGAEGRHQVHLGEGGGQLVAVALGHAPGDHQAGAGRTPVGEVEDGVDRLLAGGLDEGAGVDHHQVGVLGALGRLVAVRRQGAGQLVRVDLVLRAAQGLQPVMPGHRDNLPGTGGRPRAGGPARPGRGRQSGQHEDPPMAGPVSGEGGI